HNARWRWSLDWICEPSIGSSGVEDPAVSITSDGTIIAGLFAGLSVTYGNSCDWAFTDALSKVEVVDTSINRAAPATAAAIGWQNGATGLWRSDDDAITWTTPGADLPPGFSGVAVDIGPSNPMQIVVSGALNAPAKGGGLAISQDGGGSWQWTDIPGADDQHADVRRR